MNGHINEYIRVLHRESDVLELEYFSISYLTKMVDGKLPHCKTRRAYLYKTSDKTYAFYYHQLRRNAGGMLYCHDNAEWINLVKKYLKHRSAACTLIAYKNCQNKEFTDILGTENDLKELKNYFSPSVKKLNEIAKP